MYKHFIRPLLFCINPEIVHDLAVLFLSMLAYIPGVLKMVHCLYGQKDLRLRRDLFGLTFCSPVGLAGGFDKNAQAFEALGAFGFSFVEVGTVTPRP
jgi:dihydroorotate dehydrogenase